MLRPRRIVWRSPEEIVEIAFQRARVVMMNEAHDGWKRCIRTRRIGQRVLPVAHRMGVRYLAMEALYTSFAEQCNSTRSMPSKAEAYLSQPEMQSFIQTALDLGWTLIPYEADQFKWISAKPGIEFSNPEDLDEQRRRYCESQSEFTRLEFTNWREEQQALNLIAALQTLPDGALMLVWCGNSHLSKVTVQGWIPMGYQFLQNSGINPFVIDQTRTVKFSDDQYRARLAKKFASCLAIHGGTAGFLLEEAPFLFRQNTEADAFLLSTDNELE